MDKKKKQNEVLDIFIFRLICLYIKEVLRQALYKYLREIWGFLWEIWGFHITVSDDSSHLGCHTILTGK